ncbi:MULTISPECIES: GNAT family N-acetyltransferase [Sphingobacterium]|uniref:GNAT family N-acetyltransferase n=1 Tax=Sphingobacterium TaxID=28453 RepID=UPI00104F3638|nr:MULTISPECIES: GNAT family N-acetyltransferase [Sphingobacterium]MBB2950559.1 ribosomal-protein-alanine N-acetyltransferase [Sphingobacterium sp. JUb56]MCS3552814.1 ribosomal-protein-alanine N-acetyltransferase [Sphingobacterium sp. JUb21]MCW2259086.1 ribosomal-protein-alanine N-acetyltransferase [Sphingobacterium kitahiroshimense]NJI72817.1 GNAT family N-acetyltransferase [Sphingobacterium sp. B16(2022)]TCR10430.1 ribosomal-protein-alanine N-acetyltransferase [Sphingobacterium sp. JUb20]
MTTTSPQIGNDNYAELSDERILLRKVEATDIPALAAISFYDGIQASDIAMAFAMQTKIDQDILNGNSFHWCIIDRLSGQVVGTCGYYRGLESGEGELGCVLLSPFRGKGYMSHAMRLAITFGQKSLRLGRIWAVTTKGNLQAIKLLERLNFIKTADHDDEIEYELTNLLK